MAEGIKVGELFATLTLDKSAFQKGLSESAQSAQGASRTFAVAGAAIGLAMGGAGVAALRMGDQYDETADRIRTTTGKTGDDLRGLQQSWSNVAGRVKEDTGLVGDVLAGLSQRTGLTGQDLEDLTQNVIEYSRVTGTDARANTEQLSQLMRNWQVPISESAGLMDELYRASQATGVGIDGLQTNVTQFGPQLRAMGLDLDSSIALLAGLEQNGIDAGGAVQGLNKAVAGWTKAGKDAETELQAVLERIQELGPGSEATGLAVQTFGTRAGVKLADAIATGKFSVKQLVDVIKNGGDSIDAAAADTRDFGDGIAELKNKVKMAIGPLTQDFAGLADELGNAIYLLPAMTGAIGALTGKMIAQIVALKAAKGGWGGLLSSMGPAVGVTAGVGAGLFLIDQGLNKVSESARETTTAVQGWSESQRQAANEMTFFGMGVGEVTTKFADFLGVVAPWHQAAADARTAAQSVNEALLPMSQQADNARESMSAAGLAAQQMGADVSSAASASSTATSDLANSATVDVQDVNDVLDELGLSAQDMQTNVTSAATETAAEFHARMVQMHADAAWAGETTPGAFSDALRSRFDTVQTAFKDLKDLMRNTLSPAQQEAELIGIATSQRLAKALDDNRPEVRAQAQQIALDTIAQLHTIDPNSAEIGRLSTKMLADALPTERPALQDALDTILGTFTSEHVMNTLQTGATHAASAWVNDFAGRLGSSWSQRQVDDALERATKALYGESPPKVGPLHKIDEWGKNVADAWIEPLVARLRTGANEINRSLTPMFSVEPASIGKPTSAAATSNMPSISQTIYGVQPDEVERQTRRAIRREVLGWSLSTS